jgi:hypothetical protein
MLTEMTDRKWGGHMPLPMAMGLKGGLERVKNSFGKLQIRIYPKKGEIWNNQGEEKLSFILDFSSPYNLKD